MAYLTDYQYFDNAGTAPVTTNQGSYQYVTILDIVRNYILNYTGQDQIVDNVKTNIVRWHAKQAVKELNYDALRAIKAVEITINSSLKMIMPQDYVDFVRVSTLSADGNLTPMTENHSLATVASYLLDASDELTFDGNGDVIMDTDKTVNMAGGSNDDESCNSYSIGTKASIDPSVIRSGPRFHINRNAGVIDFSSTMEGETIVLEYITDGMEGGDDSLIKVNKFFEKYVYAYISYEILDAKFGIPAVHVETARKKRRALFRNARIRMSSIHPSDLITRSST
jgi:hypothetical protein